jgi:hypothetical protein
VARGGITVTFRLWKSAHVKAGNTYQSGFGVIEVEDVRVIPAALISEDDVGPSGCSDVAAVRELAGEHTHTRVGPDTLLHRVQFRFLGDVALTADPPAPADMPHLAERLQRMDSRSSRGSWTLATLQLIDGGLRARAALAAEIGWGDARLQVNVRKLKALG